MIKEAAAPFKLGDLNFRFYVFPDYEGVTAFMMINYHGVADGYGSIRML